MNPTLQPHVTKREVNSVITRLAYVAVNLNLKLLKNMPDSETCKSALAYHNRINQNRKAFLKLVGDSLADQVDQESFIAVLRGQFFRSYDLRMALAGDEMS